MTAEVNALGTSIWVCNGPRSAGVETLLAAKEQLNAQTTVVSCRRVPHVAVVTPSIMSLVSSTQSRLHLIRKLFTRVVEHWLGQLTQC